MAHLAGRAGIVFTADQLIEDCEDDWVDGTNGTSDLETTDFKVGSGSVKITGSSVVIGNILAYEALASTLNLSTYTHCMCWAKCNATLAAADLRLALDNTSACASPESLLDFPALTADTWKLCHLTEVGTDPLDDSTAADYVGLEWNANAQDKIVYLDDIRACKTVAGMRSWTLDYMVDTLDTTDFAAGAGTNAARTFLPGLSTWSGTFEGIKDGAPLTLFTQTSIELAESATVTQAWVGNVILTGVHPNVSADGVVTYTYDFQGVGELMEASA